MCTAKGSEVRPGVHLRGRRGTMCVAGGFAWQAWDTVLTLIHIHSFPTLTCGVFVFSSVSAPPSHPPPFLTHSPTHPLTHSDSAAFARLAWQAWDNVHCHGVGCTPWRPLSLRLFCVAGMGQCALPRDRRYALWRPLGLRLFCLAGVAQCALPRGRMYGLASLGSPPILRGRRGTMCTANGSVLRPGVPWVSASFAWQAWHNVHCQGVGCTPWRPLGKPPFPSMWDYREYLRLATLLGAPVPPEGI